MKILTFITGIGYGHTIRQRALLDFLKNNQFLVASYQNGYYYFGNKYPTIRILGPKFPEKSGRLKILTTCLINLRLPYYYILNLIKLKKAIRKFKPDVIISDFEPVALYLNKKIQHFLIFNFDPEIYKEFVRVKNKAFDLQKMYINWVYNKARKVNCPIIIPSLLGTKKYKNLYRINPIIRELPKDSIKDLLKKLNLRKQPIIIMLGGSHFGDRLLKKILSVIQDINEDFLIFGYKIKGKKTKNIAFMPFKENFLEYLKASKGIITMAGHNTLSESIILKKPLLIFPIQNSLEQLTNAFVMEKNNLAIINYRKNLSKKDVNSSILKFLNNLEYLQQNLSKLDIKHNGASQVYKIIKEISKSK